MFGFLTGWDQTMAAINAVMANHVMETSTHDAKRKIADQVAEIIGSVRRGQEKHHLLAELDKEARTVQMNFVALACDNLNIAPPFRGATWTRVKNPYLTGSQVSQERIQAAIQSFEKDGYRGISWSENGPYCFSSLYLTAAVSPAAGPVTSPVISAAKEAQYISPEDHDLFGSDLLGLLDRIFLDAASALNGKYQPTSHVTEQDGDAYGTVLITTAFKIITMKLCIENSPNACLKNILEGYLVTDQDVEDFGEDLIDLFARSAMQNIHIHLKNKRGS